MRAWSTTTCTTAATRAPGCTVEVAGNDVALAAGTPAADAAAPMLPPVLAPGSRELRRRAGRRRDRCSRRRTTPLLDERPATGCRLLHLGRPRLLPAARRARARRCAATVRLLRPGDVLVFEEVREPDHAASPSDADRSHRWAVRLTDVTLAQRSRRASCSTTPPVDAPRRRHRDRLGRARTRCPSRSACRSRRGPAWRSASRCGNIVLADHGRTRAPTRAAGPRCRARRLQRSPAGAGAHCCERRPSRCRAAALPAGAGAGAADARLRSRRAARACRSTRRRGLVAGQRAARHRPARARRRRIARCVGALGAVAEHWTPRARPARQRRRRDRLRRRDRGRRPRAAALRRRRARQAARPRHAASPRPTASATARRATSAPRRSRTCVERDAAARSRRSRNPLPAAGGIEPEDIEAARRDAPQAFRTQERAVTAADYAAAAERRPDVQRAAATFRWTGSWHTVFVTADRFGGGDGRCAASRRGCAAISSASAWPATTSRSTRRATCRSTSRCTSASQPDYFRAAGAAGGARRCCRADVLPDGRLGAVPSRQLHLRRQPVYLSRIVAAAQAVEGVECGARRALPAPRATRARPRCDDGVIAIGRLEIAQLANNPNFRERGRLSLTAGGGK